MSVSDYVFPDSKGIKAMLMIWSAEFPVVQIFLKQIQTTNTRFFPLQRMPAVWLIRPFPMRSIGHLYIDISFYYNIS